MKLLYVTSLSGHRVNGFMRSAIVAAKRCGLDFTMACNTDSMDKEKYQEDCNEYGITIHHIDFHRYPLDINNIKAYRQLLELIQEEEFEMVHCNTPIGGLIGRLCAKKANIPYIIYQAHGFHFYKGAPLKNWILYYPVEKWLSRYTDRLITIAKEDFYRAQRMNSGRVDYVHGVGVSLDSFVLRENGDRNYPLRDYLGIARDAKVVLSVGELNRNKNHMIVIKALQLLKRDDIVYVICGDGVLRKKYCKYVEDNNLAGKVILAGFTNKIQEYYRMADLFVFPSIREGIPGSIMEAIASGVVVLASDIRGIRDIIQDSDYRFDPNSIYEIAKKILWAINHDHSANINLNYKTIEQYSFENVVDELSAIYYDYIQLCNRPKNLGRQKDKY